MSQQQTVSEAGEDAVITAITEVIDTHNATRTGLRLGLGDDASVVSFGRGQVVMTTDTMAEGQDFRRRWWPCEREGAMDVGTKAAAQNLSDINAMGASTKALLISLTLPPHTTLSWVRDFYRGVIRACRAPGAEGCLIAGGDLASGESISVTITALGSSDDDAALLTRSGAEPGDVLAVSGPMGYAAAGLAMLEQPAGAVYAEEADAGVAQAGLLDACLQAQKRPAPPLEAGASALAAGATSGMDLSDGLLRDATRLAQASGVQIRLDDAALAAEAARLNPVAEAVSAEPGQALEWVLTGGEDYSLLATFGSGAALPEGFRQIGTAEALGPESTGPTVLSQHRVTGAGWDSVTG